MRVEILYPELCNLYGDGGNVRYLKASLPDAEFIFTMMDDRPALLKGKADLVYMGPMTEKGQRLAASALSAYKDEVRRNVADGTHFLFTGNSFEIMGNFIKTAGKIVPGIGAVDMYSVLDTKKRHNSIFLGEHDGIDICGFNSRFSHSYPGGGVTGFCAVRRGIGLNPSCQFEGVHLNNFYGTYLLGPLLVLNPLFTEKLFRDLGTSYEPVYLNDALYAYEQRLAEFVDPAVKLD